LHDSSSTSSDEEALFLNNWQQQHWIRLPGLKIFVNEKALEMQQVAAAESTTVYSCLHGTCRFLGCS
jgi:hypothetical protein